MSNSVSPTIQSDAARSDAERRLRQHTAGPWFPVHSSDGRDNGYIRESTPTEGGRHVAVARVTTGRPYFEVAANADLIASAPDLLAACKSILAHVEDEHAVRVGNQCTLCHSYRSILRAAIAKATGEAT